MFNKKVKEFKQNGYKIIDLDSKGRRKIKYMSNDGLTDPTQDIRHRFFRKEFPVYKEEVQKVEKEMCDILKVFQINKITFNK